MDDGIFSYSVLGLPVDPAFAWSYGGQAGVSTLPTGLMPVFPVASFEEFDFDFGNATRVKTETFGRAYGDIDDAAFDIGASIRNGEDFWLAVKPTSDPNLAAHRPVFVGGCMGVVMESPAAGGFSAVVGLDAVPRC